MRCRAKPDKDHHDPGNGDARHSQRVRQQRFQQANISAKPAGSLRRIGVCRQCRQTLIGTIRPCADHRTEHRQEDQRHDQRRRQNENQRNRQIGHELARHRVPEQEWDESRKGCRGRCNHWPEHPLAGHAVSLFPVEALGHFSVGIFGYDNGAIDQNTHRDDHAEHDHHVDRVTKCPKKQERHHEGGGDGDTHQQRGAPTKCGHTDYHHQHDSGDDRVLELSQLIPNQFRGV